jgi:hypothetical protein
VQVVVCGLSLRHRWIEEINDSTNLRNLNIPFGGRQRLFQGGFPGFP